MTQEQNTCTRCGGQLREYESWGFVDGPGIHGMGTISQTYCVPCAQEGRGWQLTRIAHRIGFREAARELGMGVVTISAIESGMPGPTAEQAEIYRNWIEALEREVQA